MTLAAIRAALDEGTTSSRALVDAALARVAAVDADVGAFLAVDAAGAAAAAAAADGRRAAAAVASSVDGVPVAVKDNIAVAGLPLTAGSKVLQGYVPPQHATCVQRLVDAGAVVVGKTNLDEFGMGSRTEHSAFQPTRNPRDRARSPGGSSGGAAAAVAAGMVSLSLGTDTGGSVRQPAAFCGVVGVKPTYGRVSRAGVVAYASSLDQVGVVADDVLGAAAVLEVICGVDPRDATTSARPVPAWSRMMSSSSSSSSPSSLAGLSSSTPLQGLRLGVPEALVAGADVDVRAAFDVAVAYARASGAVVVDVALPHAAHAVAAYYVIAMAEAASNLARYDGVRYGPRGDDVSSLDGLYESTRARFGAEVRRRLLLGNFVLAAGFYDAYVEQAQRVRTLIARDFQAAFADVDAVVLPTAPTVAPLMGAAADPLHVYLADLFTLPASLAGLPAASVPAPTPAAALPVGVQIVGRPFDEATVFRVAHALFPGAAGVQ
jgi:aspartyl-tRNA(Asn)/glutamyl-tRNA(Gln) amidotransferase subunit A